MKIFINSLSLLNFKGIKILNIEFNEHITNIYGYNGTGKTTVFDAFLWLLFDKDSTDRKTFEIKTLDEFNQPIHRLDHEVSAIIKVDEQTINLRRVYREVWEKKRGTKEPEFTRHENEYFWDEVPMKKSEYESKISGIVNESVFKLITNPLYFNTLNWKDRRQTLKSMAGEITQESIFQKIITPKNKGDFDALIKALDAKKTIDGFKLQIAGEKKKIKDVLELIPARIEEATRNQPEAMDYDAIATQLADAESQLQLVDQQLQDKSEALKAKQIELNAKVEQLHKLESRAKQIEFEEKEKGKDALMAQQTKLNDLKRAFTQAETTLKNLHDDVANLNNVKSRIEASRESEIQKWHAENGRVLEFNEGTTVCPTCKRAYDADDPEVLEAKKTEAINNFNSEKSAKLKEITAKGVSIKADLEKVIKDISAKVDEVQEASTKLAELSDDVETATVEFNTMLKDADAQYAANLGVHQEYAEIHSQIEGMKVDPVPPSESDEHVELNNKKKEIQTTINELNQKLGTKDQRKKADARVEELMAQEKKLAGELAEKEAIEYSIELFVKAEMDELESRINNKFKVVKFRMFTDQINGGRAESCDALIDGVPYSDANTGKKIQAGLDIINALCNHYQVTAPIFIDNRESVIDIPETDSQIINLIVSPDDKVLRVA